MEGVGGVIVRSDPPGWKGRGLYGKIFEDGRGWRGHRKIISPRLEGRGMGRSDLPEQKVSEGLM
jgi:hypothetical protein